MERTSQVASQVADDDDVHPSPVKYRVTGIEFALKNSENYPPAFGRAIVHAWFDSWEPRGGSVLLPRAVALSFNLGVLVHSGRTWRACLLADPGAGASVDLCARPPRGSQELKRGNDCPVLAAPLMDVDTHHSPAARDPAEAQADDKLVSASDVDSNAYDSEFDNIFG